MKNAEAWRPSKYIQRNGHLAASRDRAEVSVGSRLMTDLIARTYETNLPKHARGRLLDLGCGKVPLYLAYRGLVAENTCVDWQNTPYAPILNPQDHVCDEIREKEFPNRVFADLHSVYAKPEPGLPRLAADR